MSDILFTTEPDGTHREATPEEGRDHVLALLKRGELSIKDPLAAKYLAGDDADESDEDKPARRGRKAATA